MSFTDFCRRAQQRDDPVGDFARDWIDSSRKPRAVALDAILGHLRLEQACPGAIDAARETWALYAAEREVQR